MKVYNNQNQLKFKLLTHNLKFHTVGSLSPDVPGIPDIDPNANVIEYILIDESYYYIEKNNDGIIEMIKANDIPEGAILNEYIIKGEHNYILTKNEDELYFMITEKDIENEMMVLDHADRNISYSFKVVNDELELIVINNN